MTETKAPFGILVIDKAADMTSHDVVAIARRSLNIKKIGHAGTLDPMATGVLVLLIGKATKLSAQLTGHDKEYESVVTLGSATDTNDATGEVISQADISGMCIIPEDITRLFQSMIGVYEQVPPMHSAIKYKGTRLYTFARKGITVPRSPRQITLHELTVLSCAVPDIRFRLKCSKGTYVRTLCADIGTHLGVPAHMSYLRRLRSGPFTLEKALSLEALRTMPFERIQKEYIWSSYTE